MKKAASEVIANILRGCIDRTISRVAEEKTYRPFHEALLTKELVAASAFERSFSTSFGQGPIEEISEILARSTGAECERQKKTRVEVTKGAVDEIGRILNTLRSGDGRSRPDWKGELERVWAFKKGDHVQQRVVSDLWIKRDSTESFISIKTVKPNLDQVEIAKENMLLLKAHDKTFQTYLGLYYNPGGPNRADYNWSVPSKIFDMQKDDCVLIGQAYWDYVGGEGTYSALLEIFGKVGEETRKKLRSRL